MKIALIHDWLTVIGGSENVFKEIAGLYPTADIFTLVASNNTIKELGLEGHKVFTSMIQELPFSATKYRNYLPFFPLAIEQFDLSEYDLIISSSHAVAKGVLTNHSQLHICYCHSPIRYAWDLYAQYLKESGLDKGIKGLVVKFFLHKIRIWDVISTNRVDFFISNSNYIGKRIKKIYGRESTTIYPNVSIDDFVLNKHKDDFYFTCSRFVPYKKIDLIVRAFNQMSDKKLIVIGDGPDFKKVLGMAKSNVMLMGHQPFEVLKDYMSRAKAFVFAAEEDFGIVPVEAQACGTPVIAYGKGGALETVIENETGIFFYEQTVYSIVNCISAFESQSFDPLVIRQNAERFSIQRFRFEISSFISSKLIETGF